MIDRWVSGHCRLAALAGLVIVGIGCHSSSSPGETDAGVDAGSADAGLVDAGSVDAGSLTCAQLLTCDQRCGSSGSCTNDCYAETSPEGQDLFNALDNCIGANCSSADGGPCVNPNSSQCGTCNEQAATNACANILEACASNTPLDAGPSLNCGEFTACAEACPPADGGACLSSCDSEATPTATALASNLNSCLAAACPATDGGPCAMPGSTCNGCDEQAEFSSPFTCSTAYTACVDDTSNSPDAGLTPTALQGGTLSTVLTGTDWVGAAVIPQAGYLYYAQQSSGNVSRLLLADGGVQVLAPGQPTPVGAAVDPNNVYVWNYGTFTGQSNVNNDDGTVAQVPLDGGTPLTLSGNTEVFYSAPYLNAIAVDSHNVYWVTGAVGTDGAIMKTAIGSADAAPLYSGQPLPEAVVTDGTNVYWANWGTFDSNGDSNNDGSVLQGSVNGSTPITLASGLSAPGCMTLDSSNVYWTNLGMLGGQNLPALNSGSVMQAPIGGGSAAMTLASSQSVPVGVVVSGQTVYWTEYGFSEPGLVLSVPVGGGSILPLVSGLRNPYGLALTEGALYFTFYSAVPPTSPSTLIMSVTLP